METAVVHWLSTQQSWLALFIISHLCGFNYHQLMGVAYLRDTGATTFWIVLTSVKRAKVGVIVQGLSAGMRVSTLHGSGYFSVLGLGLWVLRGKGDLWPLSGSWILTLVALLTLYDNSAAQLAFYAWAFKPARLPSMPKSWFTSLVPCTWSWVYLLGVVAFL